MRELSDGERELSREDLLRAIDFEIGHRESMLSKHGLSIWGILVTLAALSWAALSEVFDAPHDWTIVLFVTLVGRFVLGFLTLPWMRAFGIGAPIDPAGGRGTFQERVFRHGMNPDTLPLAALDLVVMLAVSIYLGIRGFHLLAVVTGTFYVLMLLAVAFIWLLSRLRIPLAGRIKKARVNSRFSFLLKVLVAAAVLVPVNDLMQIWPLGKFDIKLGLILAGLLSLYRISISLLQPPPTTSRLRSIRSRLALGQMATSTALRQVDCILNGSPEEQYLSAKADEVIAEQKEHIRICDGLELQARATISLANKVRTTPSDAGVIRKTISEYRTIFKKLGATFKALDHSTKTLKILREELGVRVDAAKTFLELEPETVNSILGPVDATQKEVDAAKKKYTEFNTEFLQALDLLYQSQKGVVIPNQMTLKKAYTALFQD
jgi:hypothetical protein